MAALSVPERSTLAVDPHEPIVRYEDVHKRFGAKVVLDGFTLDVMKGETLVLLGRSGIGKSVALKMLLGLLRADSGEIAVAGESIIGRSEKEMAHLRRHLGMVFQGGALFDSMTVFENIAYGLVELYRWPLDRVRRRVSDCLELVDLAGIERLLPGALSGGMIKRVAIARAVATAPEILLYDEPTAGLDPATTEHVNRLIVGLKQKLGVTSLVVTHDLPSAYLVADRMAVIEKGRIAWVGPTQEAKDHPPRPFERFLGHEPDPEEEEHPWKSRASSR